MVQDLTIISLLFQRRERNFNTRSSTVQIDDKVADGTNGASVNTSSSDLMAKSYPFWNLSLPTTFLLLNTTMTLCPI